MKATTRPLPSPWNIDAAVLHLYRVWSGKGQTHLRQITLLNPYMVDALLSLWERNHQREWSTQCSEIACGVLAGIGSWRLLREPDGTGTLLIEQESQL